LNRTGAVFLAATVVAVLGASSVGFYDWQHRLDVKAPVPRTSSVVAGPKTPSPSASATAAPAPAPTPPPASALIQKVPFTTQAPSGNWDTAHEEYCEAAAIYMVGQYYQGDRSDRIAPGPADAGMGKIVAFERANVPRINLSLADMSLVAGRLYGLQGQIVPVDFNVIQQDLANGVPVVIPVMSHGGPAGRINPGYGAENVYHVIVLTGYDATRGLVYTNDAGLSSGENLAYPWTTLQAAIQAQTTTPTDGTGQPVPTSQGPVMLTLRPAPAPTPTAAPPATPKPRQ
jgi:hypothetical protein